LCIEKGGKSKGRVFGDPERGEAVIEDMKRKKRERS